jgi:hypothetical protein
MLTDRSFMRAPSTMHTVKCVRTTQVCGAGDGRWQRRTIVRIPDKFPCKFLIGVLGAAYTAPAAARRRASCRAAAGGCGTRVRRGPAVGRAVWVKGERTTRGLADADT